ncbi:long-chain fatty acid--CoA ligase [Frankia sp. CcI49]|uniref:FadD3 family acyl-CoA ligase n=1 Tax=Frankia sp. CcI49 TaxID=1745382 RepID=UPI0009753B6A|nr:FadD3 family acyl-CoA ligase [Frankia sp. CcI49]ONH55549.1 long-chain fatty acid--CoA ligase [Frankia sp. CcI49]
MSNSPLLEASIPAMVLASARRFASEEAIVDGDRRWSYADLGKTVVESVRAAVALGVEPGDRVGLWAPNSAEWILAALGVLGAGGILVPLNTRWKAEEVAYALDRAGASTLFVAQGFLGHDHIGALRAVAPTPPALGRIVTLDGDAPDTLPWAEYLRAGDAVDQAEALARVAAVRPEDTSDIMFTSGTTGQPKGVMLNHQASLRAFVWLTDVFTFRRGDRYLVVPPFFHTFGYKAGWMASFARGVTVLPQRVFDAADVLARIERERVSILLGPPTLFTDMMHHPRRHEHDLSSLRVTVPAAAGVPVELVHRLREDLGFEVVITSYGLTEAHSLVSTCRPDDAPEDVARSVGRAADGIEVRVVDDDGMPCPPGERGEVLVRGYVVMSGYWQDPQATREAIDADGWLHTGDVGVLDERGFLSIVDRKKDMVIVGGFNVYPAEIERVILQQPGVAEAAVVAAPDSRLGEVPVAFVVPRPGHTVAAEPLLAALRDRLANTKVPRRLHVVDELPRNASMKVLKTRLRELAAETHPRPPRPSGDDTVPPGGEQ